MGTGESKEDDLMPTVLEIVVHHNVRDQSVGTGYDEKIRYDWRVLEPGALDTGSLACGKIRVGNVARDSITVEHDGESRMLQLDDEWKIGPFLINNPHLSVDEVTVTIRYFLLTPWMQIPEIFNKIVECHSKRNNSVLLETVEQEEKVLALLDLDIDYGNLSDYPLKALFSACNDWNTMVIVRISQFRDILLEGVEKGALAPDDETGWMWMKDIAEINDPTEFMTDMDRYYDLLAAAVEQGNTDALDIMNMIWEPEQIIEED